MTLQAESVSGRRVADYMSGHVRCFEPTLGKYILPRMFVKASGQVCTCACFNPPEQLYIRIIAQGGLHNFRLWIDIEKCKNVPCSNECEACKYLITEYERIGAIIP